MWRTTGSQELLSHQPPVPSGQRTCRITLKLFVAMQLVCMYSRYDSVTCTSETVWSGLVPLQDLLFELGAKLSRHLSLFPGLMAEQGHMAAAEEH